MAKRVAVIGAGPSGLSVLRAFQQAEAGGAEVPEVVCFEKQETFGGLWNYTWRTGLDAHGEPVHGSMYRYLWSNGPKECLEFADYSFDEHFGKPIPSFPPRAVLADYILGRARSASLQDRVRFNTSVRGVTYLAEDGQFKVVSEDLKTHTLTAENFDNVIVATGHFSVPHVPDFEGIDQFPGRVLHGHDFRSANEFAGQDLIVVGGSYSAEDIGLQCHKYGAKSVTISYRTQAMGFNWPESIREVPEITRVDGEMVHFKDGSSQRADSIILCTGYQHHFPFLSDTLKLRTHNRLYPPGLWKGVVWEANPQLMFVGMQDQFYTFSMFDLQGWFARDVAMGRIEVPAHEEMEKDTAEWVAREEALADPHQMIDFQTDYCKHLASMVDYPKKDWDLAAANFVEWEHDKEHSITGYRNKSFKSAVTGTMAPVHHTPWLEAMDDSIDAFMTAG
ncbi:MAG: NAD(P)/FAD-dependent oxidoreductase [Pseudomonadota bacterium]